jgi:Glycosyl transferases group 1
VNIMTQRPLFRRLKLLTAKYFEIFCADTIPLVMLEPAHAESIYGPAGRELALHGNISDKLLDVIQNPLRYRQIVEAVRIHLVDCHSYHRRLQQLVDALRS